MQHRCHGRVSHAYRIASCASDIRTESGECSRVYGAVPHLRLIGSTEDDVVRGKATAKLGKQDLIKTCALKEKRCHHMASAIVVCLHMRQRPSKDIFASDFEWLKRELADRHRSKSEKRNQKEAGSTDNLHVSV